MSFEERPSSRLSGLLSKVLAAIAVVALLAAVALGGMFLLGNRAAPSPSPSASPTPRPTPTVAAQRFLKLMSDPRLSYHMKFSMLVDTAGTDVDMHGDVDVSGKDWKGILVVKSGTQTLRMELVEKAGKTYGREAGGKWRLLPPDDTTEAPNPFQSIAMENALTDLGVVRRSGKSLHRLHISELPNADQFTKSLGVNGSIDSFSLDTYVTETGVPVQALMKMTLPAQSGRATVTMTFDFSNVGKALRITAPKV